MSRMGEDGSLMLLNNQYLEVANGVFEVFVGIRGHMGHIDILVVAVRRLSTE